MLIRKFERKDAAAVSDVIRETMRLSNSRDYAAEILAPLMDYFSPEKVRRLSRERICLVAELERRVVGTAALANSELCAFFVRPEVQGKGIGTRLIKAIEDVAAENKIGVVSLASSVTAVLFYEKMGYRKNGLIIEEKAGRQIGMEKTLAW